MGYRHRLEKYPLRGIEEHPLPSFYRSSWPRLYRPLDIPLGPVVHGGDGPNPIQPLASARVQRRDGQFGAMGVVVQQIVQFHLEGSLVAGEDDVSHVVLVCYSGRMGERIHSLHMRYGGGLTWTSARHVHWRKAHAKKGIRDFYYVMFWYKLENTVILAFLIYFTYLC